MFMKQKSIKAQSAFEMQNKKARAHQVILRKKKSSAQSARFFFVAKKQHQGAERRREEMQKSIANMNSQRLRASFFCISSRRRSAP